MQVGLIPPIPDLERMPETGLHLVLSHLLGSKEYVEFYQHRREEGDYLILDNGAHELGAAEDHGALLRKAHLLGAQEVVLPDVLFDRRGTLERTKQMLRWVVSEEGWKVYTSCGMPRFMFVPQGQDRADWVMCLNSLFQLWDNWTALAPSPLEEPVIGISKDYDRWRSGLPYLIGHYVAPLRVERDFDVHCLGWPNNLWSLAHVCRNFTWVRSTDSAKPFVYAKAGILLEPGGDIPIYPRRDPEYFNEPLTRKQWDIAQRNVLVFQSSATDDLVLSNGD